jgi:hypothetical protein
MLLRRAQVHGLAELTTVEAPARPSLPGGGRVVTFSYVAGRAPAPGSGS